MQKSDDALLEIIWSWLAKNDELPTKVDAIVVGGCTDQGLAVRAAELYLAGHAPLIVVSGYKQSGMETSEGSMLADIIKTNGVPEKALLIDETASNTGANIIQSALILANFSIKDVTLIHKPYMSRRFFATAEAQWPKVQPNFYATFESITFKAYCERQGKDEVVWKMLGDFKRMDEYAARGFQSPQLIPPETKIAYEELIMRGYETR